MSAKADGLVKAAEKMATRVAGLDEDDPESLKKACAALKRLRKREGLPEPAAGAIDAAVDAIKSIQKGGASFDEGYERLSDAIDRLCRAAEADAAGAGGEPEPAGEAVSRDLPAVDRAVLEDFEMQLAVLFGLLEEMEGKDSNVISFSRNVFARIDEHPVLGARLGADLASMREALEDIEREACEPADGVRVASVAMESMQKTLAALKDAGPCEPEADEHEEISGEEADRIERHVVLLEEMEQSILLLEKGDALAVEEVLTYVRMLEGEPEASGSLAGLVGCLQPAVRAIAAKPSHEHVTVLLDMKDVLFEYFSARAEGGARAMMNEEALDTVVSHLRGVAGDAGGGTPEAPAAVSIDADPVEVLDFITETPEYIQLAESALMELETNPREAESLNSAFRGFHNIKGSAGFLKLADIVQVAHDAESLLSDARDGKIVLDGECFTVTLQALDILRDMVEQLRGVLDGGAYATPPAFAGVIADLKSVRETGKKASTGGPSTERPAPADAPRGDTEGGRASAEVEAEAKKRTGEGFIKVSTSRLDSLIDAVGELVISHSMVMQEREILETKNPNLQKNVSQLAKITRELQELSMSMRMVSLKGTFQKMSRIVRDLKAKTNVLLDFTTSGEDTEIDRNMVEEINAPLVHMVRNAVDHGIESPDVRIKNGKPERGHIHLAGYHEGGKVVIELTDDGKGLDRDRIFNKAVSLGLVKADARLTDAEVFGLILREGLSTAEKVTDVSGRGVGMDVVRSAVEKLRGRVELSSTPGMGTKVTIRLPLTLSIIEGMVVRVSDEQYVVPSFAILESFRPTLDQLTSVYTKGEMVNVRSETLPLFRLHELFNIEDAKKDPCQALVLVIGENGSRCALMVDDIVGQQQVVIKSLGEMFASVEAVSGGAIMGSGQVALILDPQGVVQMAHASA